ncbi:GTP-binding protein [Nitrincola tibetensis]|uniref:GTP-binding protein n=1 Tax=Nitrincola tibetensis TaxID=2219697 RepID=A0A364NN05_9GAMM|nr:CobW family GTP-binding protein [Nitrincola tibetensis]RAU18489.1 GTP-binding protein [Nitrincola tibetensis]
MQKRIPTNLITGFLGSGKTTAIKHLIGLKPSHEKWVVIVNEFGQVGVDEMAYETQGDITLAPLSGGCVCCQLSGELHKSLSQLLEADHFDRLLIEPTGMGHPAGILDTLRKPHFSERLDLRATLCILDPRQLDDPMLSFNETFRDQINLADILVGNKSDLLDLDQIERFKSFADKLFPPKLNSQITQFGQLKIEWLDAIQEGIVSTTAAHSSHAHKHDHEHNHEHHPHDHEHAHENAASPQPCAPIRKTSSGLGKYSCGWIFHPDDIFPFDELEALIQSIQGVDRLKGAFRLGAPWVFFNRVRDETFYDAIAYRRDSRMEIISPEPLDWDAIEAELIALTRIGLNSPYRGL